MRALGFFTGLVLSACSANDDMPAPQIGAVVPDHGVPGASVMMSGSYLCQEPRTGGDVDPLGCQHVGTVLFGTTPAPVASYTDTAVLVEVPALEPDHIAAVSTLFGETRSVQRSAIWGVGHTISLAAMCVVSTSP